MLGMASGEYTIVDLTAPVAGLGVAWEAAAASAASIGSALTASFSCFDATGWMGMGRIYLNIARQTSALSCAPVMQYMDYSTYMSILSIGQADASGTWANFTTGFFTMLSTATPNVWFNSFDWDALQGKYIRLLILNNQLSTTMVAMGFVIGRKQEA
jgi:hypothetical protein